VTVEEKKSKLRAEMYARLKCQDAALREQASREICWHICQSAAWAEAGLILFYAALPTEPDLSVLFLEALRLGKKCVFPRVRGNELDLYSVTGLTDLKKGAYGIMEPVTDNRVKADDVGLALVPGLAFSKRGLRLGKGKGFYDRLLPAIRGRTAGCCFAFQLEPELPVLEHDAVVELLVTEDGMVVTSDIS